MDKAAVVILNWNGRDYLEQFLPFLLKNNAPYCSIYIADNNSNDGSVNFLKINYPQVKIIQNPANEGFAKGYNDALKSIKAEYYILLNSDIEVTRNWIEPVISFMDKNPNVAACQPKIKSYDKRDFFEHAGAAGGFIDFFGYPFCRGRIFNHVEKDVGQYDDIKEIFWATGACLFIRAEKFHEAGGFDPEYFAHMEEIDLCWKLKNSGNKIFYIPASTVYHVGGGTLSYKSPKKTFLNFRNSLSTLYKNLPAPKSIFIILVRFILDGVAGIKFLLEGHPAHFLAVIKAHFSFYGLIGSLKRKKKLNKTFMNQNQVYKGSIVLDFYLKKKRNFSELGNFG
jgi:GT2 family glycosyltransferase